MKLKKVLKVDIKKKNIIEALERNGFEAPEENIGKILEEIQIILDCHVSRTIEDAIYSKTLDER